MSKRADRMAELISKGLEIKRAQPAQPTPDDESVERATQALAGMPDLYGTPDTDAYNRSNERCAAWYAHNSKTLREALELMRRRHQAEEQAAARALEMAAKTAEYCMSRNVPPARSIRALLPSSFTSKGGA